MLRQTRLVSGRVGPGAPPSALPLHDLKASTGGVTDGGQAEVPRVGGRAAAEQEAREAFLNGRLVRQWAGGAPWAAVDFVGVAMTAAAAAAHLATAPQVA
jgi:hypothetical protein